MSEQEFLTALAELRKKFPFPGVVEQGNENSEYGDDIFNSKDCYYVFTSSEMNGCLYCEDGHKQISDVDCRFGLNGESNYECLDYIDSSNCYYSGSFARCYDIWYSWYMDDSHDCFGCANLDHKSYCIFNVQYTQEEYEKKVPELKKMPRSEVLRKRGEVIKKLPQLQGEFVETQNSDYCDYAYFLQNCYYCFDCAHDEDCGYSVTTYDSKDAWDCFEIVRGEQLLECSNANDLYNCYKVTDSARCFDSFFLEDCSDCHNCFGCNKLSHKQYCILNVQYTKSEYEKKVAGLRDALGLHYQTA